MANKVRLDTDHSKIRAASCEGLAMSECYEPLAEHLPKVKAMEIRDDDVLLCSFPKSGTHWMYRVVDMLVRRSTEYYNRNPDSVFLEVQLVERLAQLASPRVLVTHLPFERLPDQAKDKRTKIVLMYRNPRSVLVSFYLMMKSAKLNNEEYRRETIDEAAEMFFSEEMPYHGWFGYMDKVTEYEKKNPDIPVFHVCYEDMTLNPHDTLKKLGEFLEKPVTPEFCAQVVEACSFKKQKEAEESLDQSQVALSLYRKGDMHDWKNYITVAIEEKFSQILKERADRCPFSAKFV